MTNFSCHKTHHFYPVKLSSISPGLLLGYSNWGEAPKLFAMQNGSVLLPFCF